MFAKHCLILLIGALMLAYPAQARSLHKTDKTDWNSLACPSLRANSRLPRSIEDTLTKLCPTALDTTRKRTSRSVTVLFDNSGTIVYAALKIGHAIHKFYRFRTRHLCASYYDERGRRLSVIRFQSPLPSGKGKFTKGFGLRFHPITGIAVFHAGVDWDAPAGTAVIAAANGTVKNIGREPGFGKSLLLAHAKGYETFYAHLASFAPGIKPGGHILLGQVIGRVGMTGITTRPHLHYELRRGGRPFDPLKMIKSNPVILRARELREFERSRNLLNARARDHARTYSF